MWIVGNIIFPRKIAKLRKPSCIVIKMKEISFKGAYSNIIEYKEVTFDNHPVGNMLWYEIKSKKPVDQHLNWRFTISVVVNVGWCHKKNSYPWVHKGDFLSVKEHALFFTKDVDKYVKNIELECYGKFCVIDPIKNIILNLPFICACSLSLFSIIFIFFYFYFELINFFKFCKSG